MRTKVFYTTRESIANQIREEIISGRMPADTLIRQDSVAERMGVSRMPVREAFQQLEMEGLVEKLVTRHIRVVGMSEDNLSQILRMTRDMELSALCMLRELPQFVWQPVTGDRLASHKAVVDRLNNRVLANAFERLLYSYVGYARLDEKTAKIQADCNRALNQALTDRDWDAARSAVEAFYAAYADGQTDEMR